MNKHFVTFLSPGTLVHETTTKPVDSWDVPTAQEMAASVKERHGATPFAFYFTTKERGPDDLDSHESAHSGRYYLGGKVSTLEEIEARNDPADKTLLWNMRTNNYPKVWESTKGWRSVHPLGDNDTVLL